MATTLSTGIVLPDHNDYVNRNAYRENLQTINDKLLEGEEGLVSHVGEFMSHKAESATESQKGHVGLATAAETTTGTDTTRAAHPAGVKAVMDAHRLDYVRQPGYGITTGTNSYAVTLSPAPPALADGLCVAVKIGTTNTGAATLNVNSLGAKSLVKSDDGAFAAGELVAGRIYTFRYNGTSFFAQGEGGGSNIKSIQSGVASYADRFSMDIAISSVDMTKSIVMIMFPGTTGTARERSVAAKLTTSTNLNLSTHVAVSLAFKVYWTVVEFTNVKSLQTGSYNWTTTTATAETVKQVTISSVNIDKSLVFISLKTNYSYDNYIFFGGAGRLSNSSTLDLIRVDRAGIVEWQVIEFN